MAELAVDDLHKEFAGKAEPVVVLRGVTLRATSGDALAILGPSGCGKSTLLHIIGTLDRPTRGQVRLDGQDPFAQTDEQLASFRNRKIGFVFQDHYLLPQCSVMENVLLPALAAGAVTESDYARAKDLLDRVGLANRHEHLPAELSGGERQRAAVARALVHAPSVLLADEPTGNLDRHNAEQVARLLLELQQQEKMIVLVVTHSDALAKQLNRRLQLQDGKLVDV